MDTDEIYFNNANSRNTYFTVHNVREAQKRSKGKGVKVGIIDWLFALDENGSLYSGSADIIGDKHLLHTSKGHGYMMAATLREIAPECEIYAINGVQYSNSMSPDDANNKRIENLEESIEWAIHNDIRILTYSHEAFYGPLRERANKAVQKAVDHGLITTFIHNDSPFNIFPYGCFGFRNDQKFSRSPDVNIYHMDYNTLFIRQYERYADTILKGEMIRSGNDLPYFSNSSMSPVLAGFVALLKSLKQDLSSSEYKQLLIETSYEIIEKSENWYDLNPCKNVVDIGKAVSSLNWDEHEI